MGGRNGVLHHLPCLHSPPGPGQGVRVGGQGVGVFAAVGVDPGEVDGSFDVGESAIPGLADVRDCRSAASACLPRAGRVRVRRGRVRRD